MPSANPAPASPLVPVLVCALAILILSAMDAAMKSLVIAIGVYNTVMWRSIFAAAVSGVAWYSGTPTRPSAANIRLHCLRAVLIAIIILSFFWGLARLPLAEGIALSFVAPLIALFLAAMVLGERIQKQAIWASLAGLGGVIVITAGQFTQLRFSEDVLLGTLSVLGSTAFYAYNLVLMRRQAQLATPTEIMFFQNIVLTVLFLVPAPWLATALPSHLLWPIIAVTGLSLSGQYLMSWAYARAEAQYLIPTEYSAFLWAMALGWYFFGEQVEWTTLVGGGLIIFGCLIAARSNPKLAEPIEATV
ncbi:MAG: DMT family transporter [Rhizobiales bacterium]|nr:DMT family transporter [Hyphomicrobiales bacterium]